MQRLVCIFALAFLVGCQPKTEAPKPADAPWEYFYIGLEPREGMFRSAIIVMPAREKKFPVSDAGDVMNLICQYGWQEAWISGDGRQILAKRRDTGLTGRLIATTDSK